MLPVFFLFCSVFLPPAFAAGTDANSRAIQVIQLDPDFPVGGMAQEGFEVHRLGERDPHALPPVAVEQRLLRESGLEAALKCDALEQDLLIGLTGQNLEAALKKYEPKLGAPGLRTLHQKLRAYRAEAEGHGP